MYKPIVYSYGEGIRLKEEPHTGKILSVSLIHKISKKQKGYRFLHIKWEVINLQKLSKKRMEKSMSAVLNEVKKSLVHQKARSVSHNVIKLAVILSNRKSFKIRFP